jgi:predicted TIM-barrel fold metal-dependent hydrolase
MLNWRPGTLDTLARAFPELVMIGAHLGSPWFLEALSVALYHKNVYFDLSGGAVRANSLPLFRRIFSLRDASTPDIQGSPLPPDDDRPNMQVLGKMMFGTDNPSPERICPFVARLLDGLGADDETRRRVYYRNACEVFSLEL